MYDRYSVEALSPFRGAVLPLEERQRILRNWDAAPPGFERISADKAKLTGLFPPPGNIAKITNFAPPTLDPTKAAMLALLTNADATSSSAGAGSASFLPTGAAMFAPALSKQARRVYLGNILATSTEEQIAEWFDSKLTAIKPPPMGNYVLGVQIAGDRDYAFVDFRSAEEAEMATSLDGQLFQGQVVRVRRTREIKSNNHNAQLAVEQTSTEVPENSQLVVHGVPTFLGEAHVKLLLAPLTDIKYARLLREPLGDSAGVLILEISDSMLMEPLRKGLEGLVLGPDYTLHATRMADCQENEELSLVLSKFSLTPGMATSDPSTVMQLLNVISPTDIFDDQAYEELCADLREECSQYGEVVDFHVARLTDPDALVPGLGKVFVEYRTVEQCMLAVSELAGRLFGDRTVLSSYYPIDKFHRRII